MLDRYAAIGADGAYVGGRKVGTRIMVLIGQRLFLGSMAVAHVATVVGKKKVAKTQAYTDKKKCWAPGGVRPPLSALPQISKIFKVGKEAFEYNEQYTAVIEQPHTRCMNLASR